MKKDFQIINRLFEEKKFDEALTKINKLIKRNKNNTDLLLNRCSLLIFLSRYDDALNDVKKIISFDKNNSHALINLGIIYLKQKKYEDAKNIFLDALGRGIDNIQISFNLASLYLEINDESEALEVLKKIYIDADHIDYYHQLLAEVYLRQLNFSKALNHHEIAINRNPRNHLNYFLLGVDYVWAGDKENAYKNFSYAIDLNSHYAEAYHAITKVKKIEINSDFTKKIESLIKLKKLDDKELSLMYLSLAKIYEDADDYDKSFKYLQTGNKLRKKIEAYNLSNDVELFDKIKKFYSEKFLNFNLGDIQSLSNKPIFIVGMPRSGTSLLEQILTNNSQIFGAGELNFINDSFREAIINNYDQNDFALISQNYLKKIGNFSDKQFVIDKLPLNFIWIGFIKKIYPNCRIIHIYRDPIDNCFSVYKNLFIKGALQFSYDQNDIVGFYDLYRMMIQFWEDQKINFYSINYESIIESPSQEVKLLFDYLDIEFDHDYLKIENNERWIRTASDIQLRSGINKESIKAWVKYKNNIRTFIEKFE